MAAPPPEGVARTRLRPNILVSGTPGTGKSSLCESIVERLSMTSVSVGKIVTTRGFHSGRDEELDTFIMSETDEDRLLDELEPVMAPGNVVVEHHSVGLFPERWFDLVLVLRCDNTVLYDRLSSRGYGKKKLEENVTAEIMQVVLEEARESYRTEVVHEVPSNTVEDAEGNATRVEQWYRQWIVEHPAGVPS